MYIDTETDELVMSDGVRYGGNLGIVGIGADFRTGKLEAAYGCDGDLDIKPEHRIELADYMIAQWQAFKASA